jgi:hypothetical protein
MGKTVSIAICFLLAVGPAYSKGYEVIKKAGEYEVRIKMDRTPPILGDNNIEVEIRDAAGTPVTDAKVLINYYMPPMPRMAPMNYRVDAELDGEKYRACMNFIMSGPWVIATKIEVKGKRLSVKINIDIP